MSSNNSLGLIFLGIIFIFGFLFLRRAGSVIIIPEPPFIQTERPPAPPPQKYHINVTVEDNGIPIPNQAVVLYHGNQQVDQNRTDTELGRAVLLVKEVDGSQSGRIVLTLDNGIQRSFNIVYEPESYSQTYRFDINEGLLPTAVTTGNDSDLPSTALDSNDRGRNLNVDSSVASVPTITPFPTFTPTPTPTIEPLLETDEFNDSSIIKWTSLGPVDSSRSDRFVGNVQIKEGELHFNLYMVEGYWVYNVEMPIERPIANLLLQTDVRLSTIPENGVSRFHVQLRRQPDNRYYSVVMDHTNVVTIYYVSLTSEGYHYKDLHAFHATGFNLEEGAVNTLEVNLVGNVFRIKVNDGEVEEYVDTVMFIEGPGLLQIGIDGPKDEIVNYHIDELVVREWP